MNEEKKSSMATKNSDDEECGTKDMREKGTQNQMMVQGNENLAPGKGVCVGL